MARKSKKAAQLNPAAQSLDYQALKEDWDLITDLLGGTRAMRRSTARKRTKPTRRASTRPCW